MEIKTQLIKDINDLSLQYSRGFITFSTYKERRSELLEKLEGGESKSVLEQSGILEMVNTFAGLIKLK